MAIEDSGRFIQLCSVIEASKCETFTEVLLGLASGRGQDLLSWVCDHYDISFAAWEDFTRKE